MIKPQPIPVKLPDLPTVPAGWRGVTVRLSSLLQRGTTNPKLAKSEGDASGVTYRVWGLSLAPARESGFNLCPASTPGCREHCLYFQGNGGVFPSVAAYRIARAVAFKRHRAWFEDRLAWELGCVRGLAGRGGFVPAVRLNVVSDVVWERVMPWVFKEFKNFRFYDYTKLLGRGEAAPPPNYHLTFSRSEKNWGDCRRLLEVGRNVAVVFHGPVPTTFDGFPVHSGDDSDLRFLDPRGVVVGLTAKGTLRTAAPGFAAAGFRRPLTLAGAGGDAP